MHAIVDTHAGVYLDAVALAGAGFRPRQRVHIHAQGGHVVLASRLLVEAPAHRMEADAPAEPAQSETGPVRAEASLLDAAPEDEGAALEVLACRTRRRVPSMR